MSTGVNAERSYDVIIVGAGVVGATLAVALSGRSLSVAVVEACPQEDSWDPSTTGLRVSAITPVSERVFRRLGAWSAMDALGISPFREMQVWDAGGRGKIHFDSSSVASSVLGHIIENRVIQHSLLQRMRAAGHVDLIQPARLEGLRHRGERVQLILDDHSVLETDLLVGADGGRSRVRQLAGIGLHGWQYGQSSVVAVVETEHDHLETAWQRFLPEGPLAFLPLRDGRSSIVWSTKPAQAEQLLSMSDAAFQTALGDAFAERLGRILSTGPRAAFPLRMQHARRYMDRGVVLIGDAAHTIHPLAGQGANLGILDAITLAELLGKARAAGQGIGGDRLLRRYERWRKAENWRMIAAMEGLKRLFSTTNPCLTGLRNLGLGFSDSCPPVKDLILQYHLGRHGDLPLLARP